MSTLIVDRNIPLGAENRRIQAVYAHRKDRDGAVHAEYDSYMDQELLGALAMRLQRTGLGSLANLKLLEVGCGAGRMLSRLRPFGAQPINYVGIDLVSERLDAAVRTKPDARFVQANAAQLPFRDGEFDLVFQFLVFTSVLDPRIRTAMAAEIMRTLRPGGYFISYDFCYSNPRNPNVRGFGRGEIKELFPDCQMTFQRVTLAPPIGRLVARISPALCHVFSALPILRTHALCFARKPELVQLEST